MKHLFKTSSQYSWRKILTAICAVLFAFRDMGQQLFKFQEVPGAYMTVVAGVFAFYFLKGKFEKPTPGDNQGQ